MLGQPVLSHCLVSCSQLVDSTRPNLLLGGKGGGGGGGGGGELLEVNSRATPCSCETE